MRPKIIKNRSKIGPFWEILHSFGRFGRPKGCCGGPRATRKGSGRHRVRSGPAREAISVPTWPQHGPILGAKIEQKSVGRRCEKGVNFWMAFGIQLGAVLGGFWKRKWSHVGTQNRSQPGCYLRRADTANHPRNVIYF